MANYTDQQIRDFFATNPNNNQIAAQARAGGMNVDQIAHGLAIGRGYDPANMSQGVYSSMIGDALNMTGNTNPGINGTNAHLDDPYRGFKGTDTFGGSNNGPSGQVGLGGSSGYGSGSSNLGFGAQSGANSGQNPYLSQMADDIGRRSNQALGTSLAGIRGNAVGVGGLGGSRQGVAEGVAIGNAQDSLQGNLANLYGGDWTNQQNRDLQRYGIDQSAATSRYGIDSNANLTNQGQWQNFYTAQRGQDLQGLQLGANLYGQGNAGYTGQGQGIYNIGNTQQQAPWRVQGNANSSISPYTGYGSSSTTSGSAGGGVNGYVGGALAGAQIGKNLGLGGSSSGFTPTYDSYGLNVAGY